MLAFQKLVWTDQHSRRWTMDLQPKLLPWQPHVVVTGQSFYDVDSATGKITAQRDTWDGVSDNNYLSAEGLAYIARSITDPKVCMHYSVEDSAHAQSKLHKNTSWIKMFHL